MKKGLEFKWVVGVLALSQLLSTAALAAPTCVFIIGELEGRSVAIPAVYVPPPEPPAPLPTLRVHVDPQTLTVLDYTLTTPEAGAAFDPRVLFQPISTPYVPIGTPAVPLDTGLCVNQSVAIRGIPFPYFDINQETPELIADVPYLEINAFGQSVIAGGQVIYVPGYRIVFQGFRFVLPDVYVETPPMTIVINVNGLREMVPILSLPH